MQCGGCCISYSILALNEEVYDILSNQVKILVQEFMHLNSTEMLISNKY